MPTYYVDYYYLIMRWVCVGFLVCLASLLFITHAYGADAPATNELTLEVKAGDTLSGLLSTVDVDANDRYLAILELGNVFNSNSLKAGQSIRVKLLNFETQAKGPYHLESLRLSVTPLEEVWLSRVSDGIFLARIERKPVKNMLLKASGKIKGSLYQSATDAGIPPSILQQLIQSYSYDVDFQRDIRNGQAFEALFEAGYTDDGQIATDGVLIYASLSIKGSPLKIYRFSSKGETQYYNAVGKSIKRGFLRTPVDGARISSGFGQRRHPVLGYTKMHKGIDFAAPTGTPVYAAGDGVIDYLGGYGSYGKYVRIQHSGGYSTAYAHLSRYGKGQRKGGRVKQGEIIGYVGTTGRSTGPHLHYEILRGGKQINPLSVKTFSSNQLSGINKGFFLGFTRQVQYMMKYEAKAANP